jgi:mono/diheme cytochrome c family protein
MKRIAAALLLAAFATAASADGAATFAAKCKICHGASGEGSKIVATPIKGLPEARVLEAITKGKGKMKPVAIDDAPAVAKYVAGLK